MTQTSEMPVPKPALVRAVWKGDRRFDTGKPNGPTALIDGDGIAGQSPPEALLSALTTCSGVDLVDYLAKRRTPVETLTMDVSGLRRTEFPRRFEHITITFTITGAGIDLEHAERSVRLSFERYCTVAATLAPDVEFHTIVVLNGQSGATVRQPNFTEAR